MLNTNAIADAFAATVLPVAAPRKCDYCSKDLTAEEYAAHLEAGETHEFMCNSCAEGTSPNANEAPQVTQPQVQAPQPQAPVTDAAKALMAKRDAKVDAIVRKMKPPTDDKYVAERYTKGLAVGTMAVKVHGYFKDLYRAAHPTAKPEVVEAEVNSLIQGALDRGAIWSSVGGMNANTKRGLKWYYSSAEYPKPVSKAVLAIAAAKAEAAELGW